MEAEIEVRAWSCCLQQQAKQEPSLKARSGFNLINYSKQYGPRVTASCVFIQKVNVTAATQAQNEFQFVTQKPEKEVVTEVVQEDKKDEFDDTPRLVLTSLVISGRAISVPPSCLFQTVASWHPHTPFMNSYVYDGIVPLEETKAWLFDNYLNPLIDPEEANRVMGLDIDGIFEVLGKLSKSQLMKLAKHCSEKNGINIGNTDWEIEMWNIGSELFTRLGMVRLGTTILPNQPRLWVGRDSAQGSRQIEFWSKRLHPTEVGNNFIHAFLGPDAKKTPWALQHRGGLWRIIHGMPKSYIYIEEFDDETFNQ